MHVRGASRYVVVALTSALSACSTFEIYDTYVLRDGGTKYVSFEAANADVTLHFAPDVRFGSVGLLGIPAVPVHARPGPQTSVVLDVELTLRKNAQFSFSPPCLKTPTAELCPQYARISARMQSNDDGGKDANGNRTYGHIAHFSKRDPLTISLPPQELQRITDDAIFDYYYGYRGDPPWIFGMIRLSFVYTCSSECPAEFSFAADDVVVAEGVVRTEGNYSFQKRRVKDYDASQPVQ